MRNSGIVLLSVVVGACAANSTTPEQLRTITKSTYEFCSDLSAREVYDRLLEQSYDCYHRVDETIQVSSIVTTKIFDMWVEGEWESGEGTVTIRTKDSYVVVMDIKAKSKETCETEVKSFLYNSMWVRHAKKYEKWVRDFEYDSCPL